MQPKNSIRRKPAFPDGMLIVLGVIILCVIVTWFIPSGQYDRILDASGRQIVDPNSFHYIESEKISLLRIPHFIVEGTIAQAEMIFFLLTIGGCYEIVMHTGVLQAIIARMAKWKVRDMAFILVFTLVFAVIAAPAGGVVSFIGFAPIFVMIARAMGYDALVGVSLVLLGGAVGAAAGPITPFTTGVAQGIAELPLYSGLSYRIICMLVLWIVTALFIARYAKKVRLDPSKSYPLYPDLRNPAGNGVRYIAVRLPPAAPHLHLCRIFQFCSAVYGGQSLLAHLWQHGQVAFYPLHLPRDSWYATSLHPV